MGNYEIGRFLGKGNFGAVMEAVHVASGQRCAVKVLPMSKDNEEYVLREIQAMRTANGHVNTLNLYEVFQSETRVFLVLELAPGGDFFDTISNGGITSEEDARQFFRQIVAGLRYCHERGVVHR